MAAEVIVAKRSRVEDARAPLIPGTPGTNLELEAPTNLMH